jgi:uncharacterized membrane protein YdcZ (DUF606 family)
LNVTCRSCVTYLVLLVALAFCLARPFAPGHGVSLAGSYEAFAHLFVGGLLGAWVVCRRWWLLYVVGVMSLVELLAFATR